MRLGNWRRRWPRCWLNRRSTWLGVFRKQIPQRPIQPINERDGIQDLPNPRHELAHLAGHAGQMGGKVECQSSDISNALLLLLRLLYRPRFLLQVLDSRDLFLARTLLFQIAQSLTILPLSPG